MTTAVGIDVGGTFTDLVLVEDGALVQHKTPTTPSDPATGAMQGLAELAAETDRTLDAFLGDVGLIVHGTTVTTNAILTDRGARTGLLTTEGFRDILEMRRGVRSRKHLYDNSYVPPSPLVPRYLRLPVTERVDVKGDVRTPLDEASVEAALDLLAAEGVEAVAICLLHAYANGDHERAVAERVRERLPDAYLAVSHEVLPQVRIWNRVSTTVMSAYVGTVLDRYIHRLVAELGRATFRGTLLIMQSNGGVATPEIVARNPATTVLSGPAGGPVAGLAHTRPRGSDDCVIVDMGGTSFDASIVKDGEVEITREGEINRHLIALPMIDVHTIGAGGGSIGWLDEGGLLHVGPQSAGADPGPACYGRGGEAPTCTDADL
ncbi:MAG: hydantoinase/oxoprolinase family protein, partial [Actinobacteria bacterium]|nr:hydantoinase/oxoprolinase family protein [Actinomycetota bacterium]